MIEDWSEYAVQARMSGSNIRWVQADADGFYKVAGDGQPTVYDNYADAVSAKRSVSEQCLRLGVPEMFSGDMFFQIVCRQVTVNRGGWWFAPESEAAVD